MFSQNDWLAATTEPFFGFKHIYSKAPFTLSPTNPPELVIFDNDGVLIDSEILAGEANGKPCRPLASTWTLRSDAPLHWYRPAGMEDSLKALGIDNQRPINKQLAGNARQNQDRVERH